MYHQFKTVIIPTTEEQYKELLEYFSIKDQNIGVTFKRITQKKYENCLWMIKPGIIEHLKTEYCKSSNLEIIIKEEEELTTNIKDKMNNIMKYINEELEKIRNDRIKEKINEKPEDIIKQEEPAIIDAILKDSINATSQLMQYELTKEEFDKIKKAYNPKITIKKRFRKQETTILL